MSRLFLFLVLFSPLAITAQSEEGKSAVQLQETAMAFLQNDSVISAFDKLRALGKFQESQVLLATQATPNLDLRTKNDQQIQALKQFFLANTNSDSLLATTRFFPDAVFQANPRHNKVFKTLIADYLTIKQSSTRAAFFKIKALNYRNSNALNNSNRFIDFDLYWPLPLLAI